jgi:hypothetical protein
MPDLTATVTFTELLVDDVREVREGTINTSDCVRKVCYPMTSASTENPSNECGSWGATENG